MMPTWFSTWLGDAATAILGGAGLVTLLLAIATLLIRRRSLLFDVYLKTLAAMDEPDLRRARNFVYSLDPSKPKTDGWLALPSIGRPEERSQAHLERDAADMLARSLDRLGLFAREGLVPLNLVARFYSRPILVCWLNLCVYIQDVRDARKQQGHMWEFEHLALDIVLVGLERNTGIWKGVKNHDELDGTVRALLQRRRSRSDQAYLPGDRLWIIGPLGSLSTWALLRSRKKLWNA